MIPGIQSLILISMVVSRTLCYIISQNEIYNTLDYEFQYRTCFQTACDCCQITIFLPLINISQAQFKSQCLNRAGRWWLNARFGEISNHSWNTLQLLPNFTRLLEVSKNHIIISTWNYNLQNDNLSQTDLVAACQRILLISQGPVHDVFKSWANTSLIICHRYSSRFQIEADPPVNINSQIFFTSRDPQVYFAKQQSDNPTINLMAFLHYFFDFHSIDKSKYKISQIQLGLWGEKGPGSLSIHSTNFTIIPQPDDLIVSKHQLVPECYLSSYDKYTSKCVANQELRQGVLLLLSIPNINLLIRLSPLASILQQLAYFQYHMATYDRGFSFFSSLSWNWTIGKFSLPFFGSYYETYMDLVSSEVSIKSNNIPSPKRYSKKSQSILFINETSDYWFSSLIINTVVFFFLKYIRTIFAFKRFSDLLKPFSCIPFFWINCVADNMIFLSFRAFSQMNLPILIKSDLHSTINLVLSYSTLFCLVFLSTSLYPIAWKVSKDNFQLDYFKKNFLAFMLMAVILSSKLICGFVHAYMNEPILQLSLLTGINSLLMALHLLFRQQFDFKRTFLITIIQYIIRTLIYSTLLLQIYLGISQQPPEYELLFNKFNTYLLMAFYSITIFEYLAMITCNISRWWVKPTRKTLDAQTASIIKDRFHKMKKQIQQKKKTIQKLKAQIKVKSQYDSTDSKKDVTPEISVKSSNRFVQVKKYNRTRTQKGVDHLIVSVKNTKAH